MNIKSEKGFTGIDITVALIILLLFISLISVVIFNITKTSKGIERESEATYIATSIIEAMKIKEYDKLKETTGEGWVNIQNYLDTSNNQIIPVRTEGQQNFNENKVYITPGFTAKIKVRKYIPTGETEDLVKVVNVRVEFKVGGELKSVELSTNINKY